MEEVKCAMTDCEEIGEHLTRVWGGGGAYDYIVLCDGCLGRLEDDSSLIRLVEV